MTKFFRKNKRNMDEFLDVDKINPNHYKLNQRECIEEMEIIFGKEAVKHFCMLNAWKYRYRANAKGGEEDLKRLKNRKIISEFKM